MLLVSSSLGLCESQRLNRFRNQINRCKPASNHTAAEFQTDFTSVKLISVSQLGQTVRILKSPSSLVDCHNQKNYTSRKLRRDKHLIFIVGLARVESKSTHIQILGHFSGTMKN